MEAATAHLLAIGRAVIASWDSGFAAAPVPPLDLPVPDVPLTLKLPEGYAFYALYPEAFAAASRRLRLVAAPHVIGIRSIGTGLAAVAAATLGAPPPDTVRPTGHPFHRTIRVDDALTRAILAGDRHHVIVDEGPGLSGSSFAAVAGWLEAHGVPRERIAFLPSHRGDPGAQASVDARARWAAVQRPALPFDELIGRERLAGWVETLVGPLAEPLADLSGGAWRPMVYRDEADWPAVQPGWEQLKYLATDAAGGRWLVRFAGLGGEGARKLDRARRLTAWVGAPAGLVHGFLVTRWIEGVPMAAAAAVGHADTIGRYLADRVRLLPAPAGPGASPHALAAMARANITEALGPATLARLEHWLVPPPALPPVAIDGRLDRHEWIVGADGLRKADALDHDRAHDLIGAQPIGWDVAGAILEHELDRDGEQRLITALAGGGATFDRASLPFWTLAYLAFRLGRTRMAIDALGGWPAEAERNLLLFRRYASRLRSFSM